MPFWGRPPGAKGSKQRKRWEREQAQWQEEMRVEELDSEDTDAPGGGVAFEGRRFVSDSLNFTGYDLRQARRRQTYDSESGSGYSEDSDEGNMSTAQIALRDKEEALVHSALARIRRAQERGKSEVNLRQEEVAALERRRKRMQSAATASKSRKGSGSSGGSGSERRRRSEQAMVTVPIVQPDASRPQPRHRGSGNRIRERAESPKRPLSAAPGPGILVEGAEGTSFAPIGGYYPPSSSSNRSSPTRPRSSSSHQSSRRTPPQSSYQKVPSDRHVSEGTRPPAPSSNQRVALPHEEDWVPSSRSRRNSISAQPYGHDPFEYQTGGPPPAVSQYAYAQGSGRRFVSGPPEVHYSSLRRSPPGSSQSTNPAAPHLAAASASDPTLDRRKIEVIEIPDSQTESSSEEEETSDDVDNGVAVRPAEPPRHVSAVPARKPVGAGRKRPRRS